MVLQESEDFLETEMDMNLFSVFPERDIIYEK